MRLDINDLPPKYRAQAEKQLAGKSCGGSLKKAVSAARATGKQFGSRGEFEFYAAFVLPKMASGEIVNCEQQPRFLLFPEGEYDGLKLRSVRYTADFRPDYADGTVEIVEVKSKFVRRMQRDYPLRRRVFLEKIRPLGWRFREVLTGDTAEDVKAWERMAKEEELWRKDK